LTCSAAPHAAGGIERLLPVDRLLLEQRLGEDAKSLAVFARQ
jgi:hypothetical protein